MATISSEVATGLKMKGRDGFIMGRRCVGQDGGGPLPEEAPPLDGVPGAGAALLPGCASPPSLPFCRWWRCCPPLLPAPELPPLLPPPPAPLLPVPPRRGC